MGKMDVDPNPSPTASLTYPPGFERWAVAVSPNRNGPTDMGPEVVLESLESIIRSSDYEFGRSKNNCDEELSLADLTIKDRRKKKSVKDKKKKVKNGIVFKRISTKNRR